jgi:hypothetical protein
VVVRLQDNLIPGSARGSRVGERVLAIANFTARICFKSASRRTTTDTAGPDCEFLGEHRLLACKFRQLAETVARLNRSVARTDVAGKLPATAG